MTNILKGSRPFFDDKHFPQGFSRSGDFTVPEAKLLTEFGLRLKELAEQKVSAENDDEQRFLQVISGSEEAESSIEKVWLKYVTISKPKSFTSIYGAHKPDVDLEADTDEATETEL
jgi:uncharacterized protein YifE (UPF0438 family)